MNDAAFPELALDTGALAALDDAVGAENVVMVIDIILRSAPALNEQLRATAAAGDLRGVKFVAHQLRSECAHVGAVALSARLEQIESRAGDGTLQQPVAEVALVSAMVGKFLTLLQGVRHARALALAA